MKTRTLLLSALAAGSGLAVRSKRQRSRVAAGYSFRDKSVLITGGSRGLGLVMARLLADEGARLTIVARDDAELAEAARELATYGAGVQALRYDITDRAQAEDAVRMAVESFDSIDVLVNNAGVMTAGPVEHMALADFELAMAVHMWGPLYTMMAALPHMKSQGDGRIVNISSIGGKVAVPHMVPYSASKFALTGLSDGMRTELARYNIKVTTVAPGLMRTGSPFNAFFKGQRKKEFAWFALLDTLPATSISAQRAARQIVEACRHGDPELTITIQARVAVIANALFPRLVARAMQLAVHMLPVPAKGGNELKTGWQSRPAAADALLLRTTLRAAEENNETVGKGTRLSSKQNDGR